MPKSPQDYGQRTCLHCGDTFTATYPSQVVCGENCKIARKKERDKEYDRVYRSNVCKLRRRIKALQQAIVRISTRNIGKLSGEVKNGQEKATEAQKTANATATPTPKRTYTKKCVVCKKVFQAPSPNSKTCPACIKKYGRPEKVSTLDEVAR